MKTAPILIAVGLLAGIAFSSIFGGTRAHADGNAIAVSSPHENSAHIVNGTFPPGLPPNTCTVSQLQGPLVVTDLTAASGRVLSYLANPSFDCAQTGQDACSLAYNASLGQQLLFDLGYITNTVQTSGARFFIPSGKKACVYVYGGNFPGVSWSGFLPY